MKGYTMRMRYIPVSLLALTLTPSLRAQDPQHVSKNYSYSSGESTIRKGWYLYWPEQALLEPRQPMPYPWWPTQQGSPAVPPAEQVPPPSRSPASTQLLPPPPQYLPRDSKPLPVQPVSYSMPSYTAPAYWYGR